MLNFVSYSAQYVHGPHRVSVNFHLYILHVFKSKQLAMATVLCVCVCVIRGRQIRFPLNKNNHKLVMS